MKTLAKAFFYLVTSVLLVNTTVVLGGVPLFALRKLLGRWVYGGVISGVTLALLGAHLTWAAVAYFMAALLIEAFVEFDLHESSYVLSIGNAVVFTFLMVASGSALWISRQPAGAFEKTYTQMTGMFRQVLSDKVSWNVGDLVAQTPSALFIILVLNLAFVLAFESRILLGLGIRPKIRTPLALFSAPQGFVWLFIVTLAGAFLQHNREWVRLVSLNLLNIVVVVYFFQGLAVLTAYFKVFRISVFWRLVWYFIFLTQLSLVLAVVGILDYWVNFRLRFFKRGTEVNKNIT